MKNRSIKILKKYNICDKRPENNLKFMLIANGKHEGRVCSKNKCSIKKRMKRDCPALSRVFKGYP